MHAKSTHVRYQLATHLCNTLVQHARRKSRLKPAKRVAGKCGNILPVKIMCLCVFACVFVDMSTIPQLGVLLLLCPPSSGWGLCPLASQCTNTCCKLQVSALTQKYHVFVDICVHVCAPHVLPHVCRHVLRQVLDKFVQELPTKMHLRKHVYNNILSYDT